MKYIVAPTGRKIEDLTGQVFNRLTVLEFANKKNSDNRWLWKCQCSCENHTIIYVSAKHLKSGNTKSCGCLQREFVIEKNKANALNITGERKGTLVAIHPIDRPSTCGKIWLIKCDCGNEFELSIGDWNRDKYGNGTRVRITCPRCSEKSKGQLLLRKILKENNISFQEEWTDNNKCRNPKTNSPLRFDFYLQKQNICIEYDGEQHFNANGGYYTQDFIKQVQYRDNIKNKYCIDNNIKLIRIPYTDFIKINWKYLQERGVNVE